MAEEEHKFDEEIYSLPMIGIENTTSDQGVAYNRIQGSLRGLECCIPAQVVRYNREQHMAYVQPLVDISGSEDQCLVMGRMWVSVMRHHVGNYLIDAPLKESELEDDNAPETSKIVVGGDTGWVIASDKNTCMAKMMNPNGKVIGYADMKGPQKAYGKNTHTYVDGFFVPDRWNFFPLEQDDIDNDRFVIQSADGKQRISIKYGNEGKDGDIKLYASNDAKGATTVWINGGDVTIHHDKDVSLTVLGNVTASVTGNVTETVGGNVESTVSGTMTTTVAGLTTLNANGDLAINGNTAITGTLSVSGLITATSDITTSGVTLGTHLHTSALPGTPTSGPISP